MCFPFLDENICQLIVLLPRSDDAEILAICLIYFPFVFAEIQIVIMILNYLQVIESSLRLLVYGKFSARVSLRMLSTGK